MVRYPFTGWGIEGRKEVNVERESLRTVHDDDLEGVLRGLEVYSDFVGGRLKCAFCGDPIDWENLQSLFPDSGAVKCSCNRPECIQSLVDKLTGPRPDE